MTRLAGAVLDVLRKIAKIYWHLRAPISVGAQVIVLDDDGRVLMIRHSYGSQTLRFPGGGVRRRETLLEAAARELEEETELEMTASGAQIQQLGTYTNFAQGKSDHITVFVLRPGQWSGEPAPGGIEVTEVEWVDGAAPPTGRLTGGAVRRLHELAGRRTPDATW